MYLGFEGLFMSISWNLSIIIDSDENYKPLQPPLQHFPKNSKILVAQKFALHTLKVEKKIQELLLIYWTELL